MEWQMSGGETQHPPTRSVEPDELYKLQKETEPEQEFEEEEDEVEESKPEKKKD